MFDEKKIVDKKVVEKPKLLKGKFPIVEIYDEAVYVIVNGEVNVVKYNGKDKKFAELEYELVKGKYIFK